MAVEYSIPQLLQLAGVGIPTPGLGMALDAMLNATTQKALDKAKKEVTQAITGYDMMEVYNYADLDLDFERGSMFGLPIFMPFYFDHIDEDDMDKDGLFLDSAILSVSRTRKIVITEVQGRDTSIKEFINNGDFQISVRGTLATDGISYPGKLVKRLNKYLSAKRSLPVQNELLYSHLEVKEIVVTDYEFPETPFPNIQPFHFNAISEKPAILILDEKES